MTICGRESVVEPTMRRYSRCFVLNQFLHVSDRRQYSEVERAPMQQYAVLVVIWTYLKGNKKAPSRRGFWAIYDDRG